MNRGENDNNFIHTVDRNWSSYKTLAKTIEFLVSLVRNEVQIIRITIIFLWNILIDSFTSYFVIDKSMWITFFEVIEFVILIFLYHMEKISHYGVNLFILQLITLPYNLVLTFFRNCCWGYDQIIAGGYVIRLTFFFLVYSLVWIFT